MYTQIILNENEKDAVCVGKNNKVSSINKDYLSKLGISRATCSSEAN